MNSLNAPPSVCRQRARRSKAQALGHQKIPATGFPFQCPHPPPLRSRFRSCHSAPSPGTPQAAEACWLKPALCQPAGCVQAEGSSCPYSPLAACLPGIVPAPRSAPVSPPAGGRARKAGQGCAALPGKKAQLWARQAADSKGTSRFPLAELAWSSLPPTHPTFKPPSFAGQQDHLRGTARWSLPPVQSPLPVLSPLGNSDGFTGAAPPSTGRLQTRVGTERWLSRGVVYTALEQSGRLPAVHRQKERGNLLAGL